MRRASHAGSWYSADGRQLGAQLDQWLGAAVERPELTNTRAIICPHAGYSYSGPTSAFSYKHFRPSDSIKRVFVLGPSHHYHLRGCAVTGNRTLETPVGNLKVDVDINRDLLATGKFEVMAQDVDEEEHSIEMQLPFIARILKGRDDVSVVPILVGSLSSANEGVYGALFSPYFDDPRNFFVISSDFCHWGKRFQFTYYDEAAGPIHKSIELLDREGMRAIETQDPTQYQAYQSQYQNTICGRHPITVLMFAMTHAKSFSKLQTNFVAYTQSSKCVSKNDSSVSYAAGVVSMK